MLNLEQITAAADTTVEKVAVPEWGGDVYIRTMTGAERDQFELNCTTGKGRNRSENLQNIRARLVAYCLADEAGNPLSASPEKDAAALGKKNAAVLERLWNVARQINALNQEDVEGLVGNSDGSQPDASPTA